MKISFWLICALSLLMSGCAVPGLLDRTMPADVMDDIHLYSRDEGKASNLIDRALATCSEQTEASETRCVEQALARSTIGLRAFVATVPHCRSGTICIYDHTTRRRLGFFASYTTLMVKDWRVSLDLRRAVSDVALIPVKVIDRNVFIVPPRAGKPTALPGASPAAGPPALQAPLQSGVLASPG